MVYPRDPELAAALVRLAEAVERLEKETVKLWRAITEYVEELKKAKKWK